jgi:hypothetical protein
MFGRHPEQVAHVEVVEIDAGNAPDAGLHWVGNGFLVRGIDGRTMDRGPEVWESEDGGARRGGEWTEDTVRCVGDGKNRRRRGKEFVWPSGRRG